MNNFYEDFDEQLYQLLSFTRQVKSFEELQAPVYIPTKSVWEFQFLYILSNTYLSFFFKPT